MRSIFRKAIGAALLCALAACDEMGAPCEPEVDGCGFGKVCVSCESLGWGYDQGYCDYKDYAEDPFELDCEEAWGAAGGGSSCNGDTSGCYTVWTGSPSSQAKYNCMAACAEQAICNAEGVRINCAVVAGYNGTANCATCR